MYSRIRLLSLLTIAVLGVGCGGGAQRMIRVTIQIPGATPQDVADILATPVEMRLIMLSQVDSITSISSAGRVESYVLLTRNSRPDEVLAKIVEKLPADEFPTDATNPSVELLPAGATIPAVHPTDVDCIVVSLDRTAIAKQGVSISDLQSALDEQAGGSASDMSRLEKFRDVQVVAMDGHRVPFTELAEIRVEKQPSQIVTHLP